MIKISVLGMTCTNCSSGVTRAIMNLNNVAKKQLTGKKAAISINMDSNAGNNDSNDLLPVISVNVSLLLATAVIILDDDSSFKISSSSVLEAVDDAGYDTSLLNIHGSDKEDGKNSLEVQHNGKDDKLAWRKVVVDVEVMGGEVLFVGEAELGKYLVRGLNERILGEGNNDELLLDINVVDNSNFKNDDKSNNSDSKNSLWAKFFDYDKMKQSTTIQKDGSQITLSINYKEGTKSVTGLKGLIGPRIFLEIINSLRSPLELNPIHEEHEHSSCGDNNCSHVETLQPSPPKTQVFSTSIPEPINPLDDVTKQQAIALAKKYKQMMISLVFTIPIFSISMILSKIKTGPFHNALISELFPGLNAESLILSLLATPVQFYCGWPFYIGTIKGMKLILSSEENAISSLIEFTWRIRKLTNHQICFIKYYKYATFTLCK